MASKRQWTVEIHTRHNGIFYEHFKLPKNASDEEIEKKACKKVLKWDRNNPHLEAYTNVSRAECYPTPKWYYSLDDLEEKLREQHEERAKMAREEEDWRQYHVLKERLGITD